MKYSLCFIVILFFGCKKDPGEGGNARIYGKVIVSDYNSDFTFLVGQYPAADTYVHIRYGAEGEGFDDRVKTDYNGNYSFDFLYTGKYELYIYSRDSTFQSLSGEVVVKEIVEIGKRKEEVNAPTMFQLQ